MFDPALLLAIPAVKKIVDAYRQAVVERDWRKTVTTVGAWVAGTGIVYLVHYSSFDFVVGNPADAILFGIALGASGSLTHDGIQALKGIREGGHEDHVPSVIVNVGEADVEVGSADGA